jgi:thiamine pyrophosphokinase
MRRIANKSVKGEHIINLDRTHLGQTCGLLPIGVDSAVLSMRGLEWNWSQFPSYTLPTGC